ncbi:MAG: phosphatidylserine decarboxylase [Wenzhouxiangella sp.]|nr:MAG: phosphatidylserine decarboxylase [Wenzhouxiangella sp.]
MKPALADRIAVWPQYLLPQQLLTRIAWTLSRSERPWVRKPLIGGFRRLFPVNLDEAARPDPADYPSFNAFFTRALADDARPLADPSLRLISPCDGTISQLGTITDAQLIQAKGMHYGVEALLGSPDWAETFSDGRFITIYLAPHDYHRVHAPIAGRPVEEFRMPGRLFSVSTRTSRAVPGLFARNERMAVILDTDYGPVAVVMVAALLVAGIETVWGGPHDRRPGPEPRRRRLDAAPLARGAELGRFHWGSTVIVLTPAEFPDWDPNLRPGRKVLLGQGLSVQAEA